ILETNIKNGKYGGKSTSGYSIFDSLNNNPGCVRIDILKYQCEQRIFTETYTKELSESPIDYMMIEYLNKFNEFINSEIIERNFNKSDYGDVLEMLIEATTNNYIQTLISLSQDIIGHIDVINQMGTDYLLHHAKLYSNISLISHCACSVIIFFTFFIFVSRNIKKQLRIMDVLTNVMFSIPSSLYNQSPKIKK
ncbi:hypothetical protein PIROE2DRAFT_9927, partial [Piromyces sp. E2]